MKDPLLLTYAIRDNQTTAQGPFLFDISSGLQPISIRDQLFRGHAIIKRALSDGIIRSGQTEPVLVVGGGAAGLMATMVAMQNRVPVVLVERERLFATQAPSGRKICATEYDWPASHWSRGTYPADPSSTPLQLQTSDAPDLLTSWESQLELWKTLYPNALNLQVGKTFVDYEQVGDAIRVHLDPPEPSLPLFRMAISGAGFGSERTSIPDDSSKYRGFAFWEQDPFQTRDLKLGGAKPNVIICGGGDGALQDFLRITAKKTAGEIYKLLLLPSGATQIIEERIFRAEDRTLRAFVWGSNGVLDHPIHEQLHFDHQSVVDLLFNDTKLWKSVRKSLEPLIGNLDQRLNIQLAFPCEHFSNCYSLNRFLVLLMHKYLSSELTMNVLLPRARVLDVDSVGHQCLGNPFLCHGKFHELKYADATCQTFDQAGANPPPLKTIAGGPFNVVIVRNGIKPAPPPLGNAAAALPRRQVIPYDNPS